MARRRARAPQAHLRAVPDQLPASARVAWSYLASLAAAIAAAGVVVVTNQSAAVVLCQASTSEVVADCKFSWMIWSGLFGFLLALIPIALKAKLDWWLILTMWSGVGFWLSADAIGQWWWWAAALVLPAVAALVSADWGQGKLVRRWQLAGLGAVGIAAIGAVIWWYFNT